MNILFDKWHTVFICNKIAAYAGFKIDTTMNFIPKTVTTQMSLHVTHTKCSQLSNLIGMSINKDIMYNT